MAVPLLRFSLLLLVSVSIAFIVRGQNNEKEAMHQQLTFLCDNDYLLFNGDDGYYTSGLFLRYDRISDKPSSKLKKIFSYEIGQMIYNAHSSRILPSANNTLNIPGGIEQIDRPIAGYLFGKFTMSSFYNNRKLLTLGISIGSTGSHSYAEEVQQLWHQMIGVKGYWNWVWAYQVKNELGVNAQGTFGYSLIAPEGHSHFQITPVTQATLGTSFTNFSQAVLFQIGKLRPMSSSGYWRSRLGKNSNTGSGGAELFFYYKPEIICQLYNATIQGGLFTADKGPILAEVNHLVFSHEVGIRFSSRKYCIGYYVTFRSKEAMSQFYGESFASVLASYRFK